MLPAGAPVTFTAGQARLPRAAHDPQRKAGSPGRVTCGCDVDVIVFGHQECGACVPESTYPAARFPSLGAAPNTRRDPVTGAEVPQGTPGRATRVPVPSPAALATLTPPGGPQAASVALRAAQGHLRAGAVSR